MTATTMSTSPRQLRKRPPAAGKGRKRGTPNKVTVEIREAFRVLLEANVENMQSWLDRTAARSPAKALSIVAHLAEYVAPKLVRAEVRPVGSAGVHSHVLARLGELANADDHVTAARLYEELLSIPGSPSTCATAASPPTPDAIAPASDPAPPKPIAAPAPPDRAAAPSPAPAPPKPAPATPPRAPREAPVVDLAESQPGVWSAPQDVPGYPLVTPPNLVVYEPDPEALRRRLHGGGG